MTRRASRPLLFSFLVPLLTLPCAPGAVGQQPPPPASAARLGMEIVQSGSYPELRVDGKPFFIHSATFFYYRIPRDLWEKSLNAYAALGLNTIDLYIPWNWHEPREGELDFEGRTNPRRDLRALLKMIQDRGFRLIARPGPVILNEWRNGGYPEWLLTRPEYEMEATDRLEGRYPPMANRNARDAEAAAQGWLANATHMAYARKWLAHVATELASYSVRRTKREEIPAEKKGQPPKVVESSGPLLFVQLDDDLAIGRANYTGPEFWRYVEELRKMLEAGGLDVPAFINPFDPRVAAAGAALPHPIAVMGQWYLRPDATPRRENALPRLLHAEDAAEIVFLAESLKTQPAFPPMMIEYNAGWYAPFDDERPMESPRENTLASSRLLIAHGLQGINYFPVQDTLAPAGYEVPWANRHYRWDAALDLNAVRQPRARAILRTGQLVPMWSELLASTHPRADFGLVNPIGALPQQKLTREDAVAIAATVTKLQRLAAAAGMSTEMLDAEHQPAEQLLRHPLVLLPVFPQREENFQLSEKAQRRMVEYVRQGGTLVCFPERPQGAALAELWSGARTEGDDPASVIGAIWKLGQGTVIESTKDFYSWVKPGESLKETRARMEAAWAIGSLRELLGRAGALAVVERYEEATDADELYVSERATNEGTGRLGHRTGGRGLLSVINLAPEGVAEAKLRLLSPRRAAHPAHGERIELPVSVPAGEALLLPLHFSLCGDAKPLEPCDDELIAASGELLSVYRDGRTLELTVYAPSKVTLIFQFAQQPRRVRVDELGVDGIWTIETRRFTVDIPRGPAPTYLRSVRIDLRHRPFMPEKPKDEDRRRDYDFAVTDAARLPLATDAGLASDPPLILLDDEGKGAMVVQAQNYDEMGTRISVKVDGSVRGSDWLTLDAGELGFERLDLKPDGGNGNAPAAGEIITGTLRLKGFGEERSGLVKLVRIGKEGATGFRFDFDRDGAEEWVLENEFLRAIVSPEAGGRAIALVSKSNGANLTTSAGGLRDHFAFAANPEGRRPERARGAGGLFNRAYHAEWVKEEGGPALRLTVDAPDVYPAGAHVEKTLRLRPIAASEKTVAEKKIEAKPGERKDQTESHDWGGLEVNYRVSLAAATSSETQPQSFVAVHSLPALLRGDRTTRFCWTAVGGGKDGEDETCERFEPGGAVAVPAGVTRMSIRTPGSHALELEWSAGTLAVEMKNYSVLLRLIFPPLTPGGAAGEYTLKFTMKEAE